MHRSHGELESGWEAHTYNTSIRNDETRCYKLRTSLAGGFSSVVGCLSAMD